MARDTYGRWNVYFGKTSSNVVMWMYDLAALDLLLTVAKYLEWASSVDPTVDSAIVGWMRVNGFRVFGCVEILLLLFLNQVNNGGEWNERNQCMVLFFITLATRITAYAFILGGPADAVWVGSEMLNQWLHLASIVHFVFWGCIQIAAHGEWYQAEYHLREEAWQYVGMTSDSDQA